jgi:flagellar biosynthetic protein FliQ
MESVQLAPVLQQSLFTALSVAGPILLATLTVGLLVSILQAATQVNEATLTFVPKLLVVAGVLIVMGPGMSERLIQLTRLAFQTAGQVGR